MWNPAYRRFVSMATQCFSFPLHYDGGLPHQTVAKQTWNVIFNESLLRAWRRGQPFSQGETRGAALTWKCTGVLVDRTFWWLVKWSWYLSRVFTFKMSTEGAFAVPVTVLDQKKYDERYLAIKVLEANLSRGDENKFKPHAQNRILVPLSKGFFSKFPTSIRIPRLLCMRVPPGGPRLCLDKLMRPAESQRISRQVHQGSTFPTT